MKFYLVYMYQGKVVDITSYDNEESQMRQFHHDSNLPNYQQYFRFDSIQPFTTI